MMALSRHSFTIVDKAYLRRSNVTIVDKLIYYDNHVVVDKLI
jgi:hypothetical protein